jgi:glucose/arabinose dehydrogenase
MVSLNGLKKPVSLYNIVNAFICPGMILIAMIVWGAGRLASAITTQQIVSGLDRPLFVTAPPDDTERLFIVEQHTGRIKILHLGTGMVNVSPFLDLDGLSVDNEQGLLGLAFHPDYRNNGFFYVNFTDAAGTSHIRRYQVSTNPDLADPGTATAILSYSQPQANHNGGWLAFGPNDGYLYISTGDGGGTDDNDTGHTADLGNGQDITDNLLGKILRLDVDNDDFPGDANLNYAIPATNPFVGQSGDDEIWAYGLRNPWRPGFDRQSGDLYIADVGQNLWEEINFQPASSSGGENYGWRVMEGTSCHSGADPLPCNDPSFVVPIHEYSHGAAPDGGFSITGGYVYRGPHPALQGMYFFADYITEQIWTFRYEGMNKTEFTNRTVEMTPDIGSINDISSFGEDARGNLYIVDLGGELFRILPEPVIAADLDGDGMVTLTDFARLSGYWLESACGWCGGADFDEDQAVTLSDLTVFITFWLVGTEP